MHHDTHIFLEDPWTHWPDKQVAEGSTWSDTNRLNMERWTVAGEERCRTSRTDTANGGWPQWQK